MDGVIVWILTEVRDVMFELAVSKMLEAGWTAARTAWEAEERRSLRAQHARR